MFIIWVLLLSLSCGPAAAFDAPHPSAVPAAPVASLEISGQMARELLKTSRPIPLALPTDLLDHPLSQFVATAGELAPAGSIVFAFRLLHEKYQKGKVGEHAALENLQSFSLDPRLPLFWAGARPPDEGASVLVGAFDLSGSQEGVLYPSKSRGPGTIKMNDLYQPRHRPLRMSTSLDDIVHLSEVDVRLGRDGVVAAVPFARYRETLMRHMGLAPDTDPWTLPRNFEDFFKLKTKTLDLRAFLEDLIGPKPPS